MIEQPSPAHQRRHSKSTGTFPRLVFYGGKGGVGKTTCAAARAAIEAARGARVLVVSTDPAHSLGNALAVRLSNAARAISIAALRSRSAKGHVASPSGSGRLHALELDARRAFARWLGQHRGPLADVLEHGTWLDRSDVDSLLDLPLPGIDELAAMLEIARLSGIEPGLTQRNATPGEHNGRRPRSPYDIVVIDTAPTGHTLRLLSSPETVVAVAHVLDDLQEEHRIIRERFARASRAEAADRLIAMLAGQAHGMARALRDQKRTTFHWVTLPETLSLAETDDGIAAIEKRGMRVGEVIVNRVLPAGEPCPVCDDRRKEEQRVIAAVARRFAGKCRIRIVAAQVSEPRGVEALARIGRGLVGATRRTPAFRPAVSGRRAGIVFSLAKGQPVIAAESLAPFRDASLLFFAGKGGVGKTTVAAAAALRLARANPARRMLLLSTDPAHSLGDVFDLAPGTIGDVPGSMPRGPSNLHVRELDAVAAFAARRGALEAALDDIAASFGAGALPNRSADLMELAPPGIDELFGILSFVEASGAYHAVVVDMAPTGHALRLLQQPAAARQWVQALLRVLLKYRSLARPGQLAQELVALSKSIRDLQVLLHDGSRTHVVAVTRAADLPLIQTERLLSDLRRLGMAVPAIVVNAMTLGPGRCPRCRRVAAAERSQLAVLQRQCRNGSPRCAIIQTPLSSPPPRGIASLEEWAGRWLSALDRPPSGGGVRERRSARRR